MSFKEELEKAQELEAAGKNEAAAKAYEKLGTKTLREGSDAEKKQAPKIFGKSIARYILAGNKTKAQDLAFQVLFMKEKDPFLSMQIETAISTKKQFVRTFMVQKLPEKLEKEEQILRGIPQNRKVLKIEEEITVKKMWERTVFGNLKQKYDLINKKFKTPKELINFVLASRTGVVIIGGELQGGKAILVEIASTFNDTPVEVIEPVKD